MLTAARALMLNAKQGARLPQVEELQDLYDLGYKPRRGELTMIAGKPGTRKSGFAMWYVEKMGLPALYMSGDMSPHTASLRVASMLTGMTEDEADQAIRGDGFGRKDVLEAMEASCITFGRFGEITWRNLDMALSAHVEVYNEYPAIVVIDNLMDIQGASNDYSLQMEAMQNLSDIKTELGITVIVLHHASDRDVGDRNEFSPPPRVQIKNKLGEKPECVLTIGFNPNSLETGVAVVKQRSGPADPSASTFASFKCKPETNSFEPWQTFRTLGKQVIGE